MNRDNRDDVIIPSRDCDRFRRIRNDWFNRTRQSSVPELYEQAITTTKISTINKEANANTDEMTTTRLERSPMRRVNLVSGPHSAYARLFPDRYRHEQEEFVRRQRSKSTEDRRYNFDRFRNQRITNDDDCSEMMRKARQFSFCDQQEDRVSPPLYGLHTRTKSVPCLNDPSIQLPFNYDPNPEIIYQDNPEEVVYVQKVGVRYLEPPSPPPPEPIIIREIQPSPPQELPPLILSTTPPIAPRTPSPLIVREEPPTPPLIQPTKIITKTLPPQPTPPRRVIIKRQPPLPAKPRPVIIEKWLPYKPAAERPVIYERAEQTEPCQTGQRNVILQYDPPRVRIEQEVQNVGCFRVDPEIYRAQFGTTLRRSNSIRKVLEDIGCNPDVVEARPSQPCDLSTQASSFVINESIPSSRTCFTDQQLAELIEPANNIYRQYETPAPPTNCNGMYYTTVVPNN